MRTEINPQRHTQLLQANAAQAAQVSSEAVNFAQREADLLDDDDAPAKPAAQAAAVVAAPPAPAAEQKAAATAPAAAAAAPKEAQPAAPAQQAEKKPAKRAVGILSSAVREGCVARCGGFW